MSQEWPKNKNASADDSRSAKEGLFSPNPNREITQEHISYIENIKAKYFNQIEEFVALDKIDNRKIDCVGLGILIENIEKVIIEELNLEKNPDPLIIELGYFAYNEILEKVFREMKNFAILMPVDQKNLTAEEFQQAMDSKTKMLNFSLELADKYLSKKEKGQLFINQKQAQRLGNPYRTLFENTPLCFALLIKNYPKEIRNRIDANHFIDTFSDLLKTEGSEINYLYEPWIAQVFGEKKEYSSDKIIEIISTKHFGDTRHEQFSMFLLTDLIGAEEALKKINSLIVENEKVKNNEATENLKFARTYLVPTKDKEIFAELESFYRKFNIKEHQINNDLNEKEVSLLQEIIPRGSRILESGCGTGRLLLEMKKAGYDISGYDLSPENIEEIKKEDPEADISIEDWHHTPYAKESFDTVYSLGRNILHEYSLPGQVQIFRETARVLKKGGQFIFDIADREKGVYAENRKKYKELMNAKGIYNLREGTIHDSPNGEHFATRYAYSNEDIENLAQLAGFRIAEVRREPLPTGKGDENLYYVLEKM